MKTLIVDDALNSRRILRKIVNFFGENQVATNGEEAVKLFQYALKINEPFDVIFLDIMMPKMNGQEALEQIRAFEQENDILLGDGVKVVMITGLNDSKNIFASFKSGCEKYLIKPINKQKVLEILEEMELINKD